MKSLPQEVCPHYGRKGEYGPLLSYLLMRRINKYIGSYISVLFLNFLVFLYPYFVNVSFLCIIWNLKIFEYLIFNLNPFFWDISFII